MFRKLLQVVVIAAVSVSATALADELTEIIQKDLVVLGYDPGNIGGELSTDTIVAISKFQAENNLEITGQPTPQLAGIIKARISQGSAAPAMAADSVSASAVATAAPAAANTQSLQQAQQACLQEKMAAAAEKKKKKRGFGSLMRAVTNTAVRYGGGGIAGDIAETSRDVYDANATASDWERAAKDLGLTTDDIEACQNPYG